MNRYGDGYEEATEPGPDVERQWSDGKWEPRFGQARPLIKGIVYRRPIKLRVGERYRCRNGAIVEVVDNGRDPYPYIAKTIREDEYRSYKSNGVWSAIWETPHDIIEHVPKQPKEKPMNDQTITVNNVTLTHDQVQEAYDKMVKAKAENEIKVDDWVVVKADFKIVKIKMVDGGLFWFENAIGMTWVSRDALTKIHLNPEQKAWLDSLIVGVE